LFGKNKNPPGGGGLFSYLLKIGEFGGVRKIEERSAKIV